MQNVSPVARLMAYLPRGNTLDDKAWRRRHRMLEWILLGHVPGMAAIGFALGNSPTVITLTLIGPVLGLITGYLVPNRRLASFFVTGGLVFCSAGLVVLTSGSIEAHFHFFIIIGFIALYQDWVPFLWNVTFTVLSHGVGTLWLGGAIFSHAAGQANPWLWSFIHGIAVLAACTGMVIFWRVTEDEQIEKESLGRQLLTADAEIGRRRFTSDMLVNLARRNQSMLYRQLDIISQLEEKEQDPDALAELFTLDHLATRVRRNAESLLVLAGEQPARVWSGPVALRDVVRAAIAETEHLDRVVLAVPDAIALNGNAVTDLTHLVAELTENAVRFSPPDTAVTIRARPDRRAEGSYLLTIEDWGVGLPPAELAAANELLATPHEVDLAVAQRLGFHVVARLAARHAVTVSLNATPGSGITAIVVLPATLFIEPKGPRPVPQPDVTVHARPYVREQTIHGGERRALAGAVEVTPRREPARAIASVWVPPQPARSDSWRGWWDPALDGGVAPQAPEPAVPNRVPRPRQPGERRELSRRVPQAHLAPELRRPGDGAGEAAPGPDGGTAEALSRYQSNRNAAQAVVERTLTEGNPV